MIALSFRARLAILMGGIFLVISAVIWFYLPRKLEEEAIALVAHQAETLARMTAFTIHPALYFRDPIALDEALSGTRDNEDVAYVVVVDPGGQGLAAFHPERASPGALARTVNGGAVSGDRSLYEVMTTIRDNDQHLARLYIGMSLARLNREIAQTRMGIGAVAAVLLAVGLMAVVLISNLMTRPLRHVAAGARQIAAGDLGHRVPAASSDEVGQLAASFNDMAEKVADRDAALRQLSKRLLSVQEQERVRIAREVHDELGQALTSLKIDLQQIGSRSESLQTPLRDVAANIDQIVDLVRRIASDLRPAVLDDLGVTAALEQQLRRLRESTGITTTLTVSEEPQLDMLTGATVYRIVQEALANVVRHADATEVEVSLVTDVNTVELEIKDNGRGMLGDRINNSDSLGLMGIRERAQMLGGNVSIISALGEGTILKVTLPLVKEDHNAPSPLR